MNDSMIDVLVAGAGPYGLSVSAYARERGLEVRTAGRPMHFWDRHMPRGMLLKSEPFASSLGRPAAGLSFLDHCREDGESWPPVDRPIPVERFVAYGRWYADRAVPDVEDAEVLRVEPVEGGRRGHRVTLSTGETVAARTVVLATGVHAFAHVPPVLAGLPAAAAGHSSEYRDLDGLAGQEVAVVGAGQSALETAALLAEAGAQPVVVARAGTVRWNALPRAAAPAGPLAAALRGPRSGLGSGWRTWVWAERPAAVRLLPRSYRRRIVRTTLGPAGAWWLRDRLAGTPIMPGQEVTEAVPYGDRVRLSLLDRHGRRRSLVADHVIAATGYVPDVHRLSMLPPAVLERLATIRRSPMLSGGFESSVPGLYFAGLPAAATFGPVMRFVHGTDFAARRIAGHIAGRVPARQRPRVPARTGKPR